MRGEISQLRTMLPITPQSTAAKPAAATPAPSTPPTIECVVEIGAPRAVARLSHRAAASSAAIMSQTKVWVSGMRLGSMMPLRIVPTTSPPAMMAPAASKTAATSSAPPSERTRAPTAGPTLLATSFAPMFSAM